MPSEWMGLLPIMVVANDCTNSCVFLFGLYKDQRCNLTHDLYLKIFSHLRNEELTFRTTSR